MDFLEEMEEYGNVYNYPGVSTSLMPTVVAAPVKYDIKPLMDFSNPLNSIPRHSPEKYDFSLDIDDPEAMKFKTTNANNCLPDLRGNGPEYSYDPYASAVLPSVSSPLTNLGLPAPIPPAVNLESSDDENDLYNLALREAEEDDGKWHGYNEGENLTFAKGMITLAEAIDLRSKFIVESFPEYRGMPPEHQQYVTQIVHKVFATIMKMTFNNDDPEDMFRKRLTNLAKNMHIYPEFRQALVDGTYSNQKFQCYCNFENGKRPKKRKSKQKFNSLSFRNPPLKGWKEFNSMIRFWDEKVKSGQDLQRYFDFQMMRLLVSVKSGYLRGCQGIVVGLEPLRDRALILFENGKKMSIAYEELYLLTAFPLRPMDGVLSQT